MIGKLFQSKLVRYITSFLSGGLLPLAFAPANLFFLAFIIPGILLCFWRKCSKKEAFIIGWLFGFGFFLMGTSWIYVSLHIYGGAPPFISGLVTLLFTIAMGLFFAFQGVIFRLFPARLFSQAFLSFPITWVLFEWLRSWLFTGFPWLFLGYSQTTHLISSFAPILGVYGVSLFTLWINAALITLFIAPRRACKIFSICTLIFIFIIAIFLHLGFWTQAASKPIKISLVQGNISQFDKWNPKKFNAILNRYTSLTQNHWDSSIIIWPEAAIPMPERGGNSYLNIINYLAKKNNAVIISGIPVIRKKSGELLYYNGIITLGSNQKQSYLKEHLVPFGEYLPLPFLFDWFLETFDIPLSDQTAGPKKQPPFIVKGINFAPFICYEIAYPNQVLKKTKGSQIILVITDDSWFGKSLAPGQHLQIAQMRALETGRYLLFSTNNGLTAVVNPKGIVVKTLPTDQAAVLTTTVIPAKGETPLMYWDYTPLEVLLIILLLLALFA